MTRYLDRGPQVGDTIEVSYVTTVTGVDTVGQETQQDGGCVYRVPGHYLLSECVGCDGSATVRVVASEPKVGDVVTADMDLPEGSIIEFNSERNKNWSYNLAYRVNSRWRTAARGDDVLSFHPAAPYWRIVRIGAAS